MVCDKSQQQEIARLRTLFSKVTVSFDVTALMRHRCARAGVEKKITGIQNQCRDVKQMSACSYLDEGYLSSGWSMVLDCK